MTAKDYKLLAKSLGRAKEFCHSEGHALTAFNIVVECVCIDAEAENPDFSKDRFLKAIEAAAATIED
jgi:hypothetical protein